MSVKGKTLRSQSQQLVLNLLNYFEQEKAHGGHLISLNRVQQRVADALQISLSSVNRIKQRSRENNVLSSPGKKRPRKKVKSSDIPDSSKAVIRDTIYKMYSKKQHVTVDTLNTELKEYHILLSNSSLNRALHSIGFKFKKEDNRRALMERNSIANLRIKFLKGYMENLNSSLRQVVYMDETWIYSKGNPARSWQDENVCSVRKPEGYDGKRFIVIHAGTQSGFIENASLLFASKSQKADYHGEMTAELFKKWLMDHLISNLKEPSLVILDNAPYHSTVIDKMPSSAWTKADIATWLTKNHIPFDATAYKVELLALAKSHTKEKRYEVDELLRSHGHEALRLPPYHCQFNAIELIWAHAKGYYDAHIGRDGYGDENVIAMWNEALQQCTPDVWSKCVRHTEEIIKTWYEREKLLDVTVNELIISVGEFSDSSDSSWESDETQ